MTLPVARDLSRNGIRVARSRPGSSRRPCCSACRRKRRNRSASRCRFRRGWAADRVRAARAQIIENEMLNGEVIRLDGAIRMAPR
jgi:hypothetical protein